MTKYSNKLSSYSLIIICLFISVYRLNNVNKKEMSWDVLGYYLPLPATFIHDQPMLDDITWIKTINEKENLTATLYQISENDKGEPMYVFLFGMALLFLPFFFLGHGIAAFTDNPMNGFSAPYQYAMVIGAVFYTIIGLIYFRKILRHFFSEQLSALIMLIIVFGTNYIHHLTLHDLETVNILFMMMCILVWNTIKWHEGQKLKNMLAIGICIALVTLVKPSEAIIALVPLLWNVTSFKTLKEKMALLLLNKKSLFIVIIVVLLMVLPQMLYWHAKTGHFIYDSYKNPGVGLDIFSPHIFNVLFSYRKGWMIYTPVMLFALWGFYFLYKNNKNIFYSILIYFLISFYIICSWSYWYYGAAFSCRPVITIYPLLAICLGYFILFIQQQRAFIKNTFALVVILCIFLNQFQWWQLKNYILDPYRTTEEYYWATFLETSVDDSDKELLSVYRDFSGKPVFEHPEKYYSYVLTQDPFNDAKDVNIQTDSLNNRFYKMLPEQEFYLMKQCTYKELTKKDHAWIRTTMDVRYPDNFSGSLPCLVMTMEYKGGVYGYLAPEIKIDSSKNKWYTLTFDYLTPEPRTTKDIFKCYVWKRGSSTFDIDNFKIEVFEPKNP